MAHIEVNPPLRVEPARSRTTQAPAQLDLRKITTPILLHLLRGKVRFPWLLLVKCKLTVNRFKRTIHPGRFRASDLRRRQSMQFQVGFYRMTAQALRALIAPRQSRAES
jgi:hypothetical protein